MSDREFNVGVAQELGHYVYRLVDPRDGRTFYVGKGQGNRVFNHINRVRRGEDSGSKKDELVQSILWDGLEPLHVIHRHGLADKEMALLVESALIDAYPDLLNEQSGHQSPRYGCATTDELDMRYAPREFPTDLPVVLVKIKQEVLDARNGDRYETTRGHWRMGQRRVDELNATPHHVAAILERRCVALYTVLANGWEIVPNKSVGRLHRYRFTGEPAEAHVWERFKGTTFLFRSQWPIQVFNIGPIRKRGVHW